MSVPDDASSLLGEVGTALLLTPVADALALAATCVIAKIAADAGLPGHRPERHVRVRVGDVDGERLGRVRHGVVAQLARGRELTAALVAVEAAVLALLAAGPGRVVAPALHDLQVMR